MILFKKIVGLSILAALLQSVSCTICDTAEFLEIAEECTEEVQTHLGCMFFGVDSSDDPGSGMSSAGSSAGSSSMGYGLSSIYGSSYSGSYGFVFQLYECYSIDIDVCGTAMTAFESCMNSAGFTDCGITSGELEDIIDDYKNEFCDGDELRGRFDDFDGAFDTIDSVTFECDQNIDVDNVVNSYYGCYVDIQDQAYEDTIVDDVDTVNVYFKQIFTCMKDVTRDDFGCSEVESAEEFIRYVYMRTLVPGVTVSFDTIFQLFEEAEYNSGSSSRSQAVVYGDPHIRTWNSAGVLTCIGVGNEFNYMSHDYIKIKGTDSDAGSDEGTWLVGIEIEFYKEDGGNYELAATYTASGDNALPTSFATDTGDHDVDMEVDGNVATFKMEDGPGTYIKLRRLFGTYMLVVRQPDSVWEISTGRMASGCEESVDITDDSRRRRRSGECDGVPSDHTVTCQYDFSQSGNADLSTGPGEYLPDMEDDARDADEDFVDNEAVAKTLISMVTVISSLVASIFLL